MPHQGTGKRRCQGGLSACNGCWRELSGCREPRRFDGGRSSSSAAPPGGGGRVCNFDFHYIPSKTTSFWYCFKKKINLIEPADSEKTDRFVRFTSWIVDSSGPTPIQCYSDPIDQTGPESWLDGGLTDRQLDRSVRFLKPWYFMKDSFSIFSNSFIGNLSYPYFCF